MSRLLPRVACADGVLATALATRRGGRPHFGRPRNIRVAPRGAAATRGDRGPIPSSELFLSLVGGRGSSSVLGRPRNIHVLGMSTSRPAAPPRSAETAGSLSSELFSAAADLRDPLRSSTAERLQTWHAGADATRGGDDATRRLIVCVSRGRAPWRAARPTARAPRPPRWRGHGVYCGRRFASS